MRRNYGAWLFLFGLVFMALCLGWSWHRSHGRSQGALVGEWVSLRDPAFTLAFGEDGTWISKRIRRTKLAFSYAPGGRLLAWEEPDATPVTSVGKYMVPSRGRIYWIVVETSDDPANYGVSRGSFLVRGDRLRFWGDVGRVADPEYRRARR
jgi:hypothetical protein